MKALKRNAILSRLKNGLLAVVDIEGYNIKEFSMNASVQFVDCGFAMVVITAN